MLYDAEQVKLMFDEHAILFYDQEGVTFYDAIRLFGENAADFAWHYAERGVDILNFGEKEDGLWEPFYTYRGFCLVATYANLLELREKRRKMGLPVKDLSAPAQAKRKPQKAPAPKVIDISAILKNNAAIAAQQKVR